MQHNLSSLLDAVADAVAAKVAARLSPQPAERVSVADAKAHGAPSPRWLVDQARAKRIAIHGPRGGRFVMRDDLEALLKSTAIKRHRPAPETGDVAEDARNALAELAAKRTRRAAF